MIKKPTLVVFPLSADARGSFILDGASSPFLELRGFGAMSNALTQVYGTANEEKTDEEFKARAAWIVESLNALEAAGVTDPKAFIEEAVTMREAPDDCSCVEDKPLCDKCAAERTFDEARGM